LADTPAEGREQRVVFMTDMMPNAGATDEGELASLFADAASTGVHTTFVGMGLDENADLELVASWTERDGEAYSQRLRIELPDAPESYAHDGVRKAIALSRYARELRSWAETVHTASDRSAAVDDWLLEDGRSEHERDSVPLAVPDDAAARFQRLRAYLTDEMVAVDDETLQQELDLLTRLCSDTAVGLSKRPE